MSVKVYFKSGKGIENPVDAFGNKIKEGDILTGSFWDDDGNRFFNDNYPHLNDAEIEEIKNKPCYVVKWNAKGFFYAEGIEQYLYLHYFRFKETKKINPCS